MTTASSESVHGSDKKTTGRYFGGSKLRQHKHRSKSDYDQHVVIRIHKAASFTAKNAIHAMEERGEKEMRVFVFR